MDYWYLVLIFFLIAVMYASVGFGGGSSYLAVLALYGLDFQLLRIVALLCNIIVVSGGTILYIRSKLYKWKRVLPLILLSIPAAYAGGRLLLQEKVFFVVLGTSLVLAAVFLWVQTRSSTSDEAIDRPIFNMSIGGGIGFLSGLVGIGGGIFLSPILHLSKWDAPRVISATASFFILVNSIAGLTGQLEQLGGVTFNYQLAGALMMAVFAGGQVGTRLGLKTLRPVVIKRLTAILVCFVGVRTLVKYLPFF